MNRQTVRRFIGLLAKGPSHAVYFLKNVHFIRDNFPVLYRILNSKRELDLGGPSKIVRLHVILRTTDTVMNLNATRRLEAIGIRTKNDIIRTGGCSLFAAAGRFVAKYGTDVLRITLVTDGLSAAGLSQYTDAAADAGVSFDTIQSKGHGNGPSFQTQIDVALDDDDGTLELILEDDYMLDPEVLCIAFELFVSHEKLVGFNPHFHPDRVRFQDIGRLAVSGGRLYCRVPSTCCTFFIPRTVVTRYIKSIRLYDGWEKGSIGNVWEKEICLAPLGWTLAEHLHRSDLSPVQKLV